MKSKNSKLIEKKKKFSFSFIIYSNRMKKQYDSLKGRCFEHEKRIEQLLTLLNEKQILVDDLNAEKR
jgi:hypothetical protein